MTRSTINPFPPERLLRRWFLSRFCRLVNSVDYWYRIQTFCCFFILKCYHIINLTCLPLWNEVRYHSRTATILPSGSSISGILKKNIFINSRLSKGFNFANRLKYKQDDKFKNTHKIFLTLWWQEYTNLGMFHEICLCVEYSNTIKLPLIYIFL